MKVRLSIFSCMAMFLIISCRAQFNYSTFEKENISYLEGYSMKHWSSVLDSVAALSINNENLDSIKTKYGAQVVDIAYMESQYGKPEDYDIWLVKYGDLRSLLYFGPNGHINEVSQVPECIVEMYRWRFESGEPIQILYLRKGKELIPFDASWFPKGFLFPE